MAGESSLLTRVRAAALLLDDDALAALANKGLVRRARKDLETNPPTWIEPAGDAVRLQVEDCAVELFEILTQSKCTCPASGICRHILTAVLFLQASPGPVAPASDANAAQEEILAVTEESLRKWAGKALLRKALQTLSMSLPAEFEEAATLLVRFPTWNVTCRWLPGGDLGGMICSCHASGACEHRVAAVLAYQAARGRRQIVPEDAILEASAGAPRSREEVLASVGVVLREMVALGLSRLSRATEERLRTLAVSAHGVDLPRLERMLRALADEVALSLRRDAQAATGNLLATASRIEALRSALSRPVPDLVGIHRSRYEKVGDIDLIGVGARQWRTRSGYLGLTVYFWDRSMKNWVTWSESRPVSVADFNPANCYYQDGPWAGSQSPSLASRHSVRLLGAWRNRAGRLSGRPGSRCLVLGETDLTQVPAALDSWSELAERASRLFAGGLKERSEQDEIVLLKPRQWGPAGFDAVRQELVQPVFDSAGKALLLVMPHTPQTANAIPILERDDATSTWGLLGLLRLQREQLAVEPITLYRDKFINLTLDGMPTTTPTSGAKSDEPIAEEEIEESEPEPEPSASASSLGLLFTQIAEQLEAMGEGGLRSTRAVDRLPALSSQCDALGLASIARQIARLADQLDQIRKSIEADVTSPAGTLLRAYYLVKFAAAQEVVAGATASIRG
jgi:SWIM zinc finger